jgi:hypothetical protein
MTELGIVRRQKDRYFKLGTESIMQRGLASLYRLWMRPATAKPMELGATLSWTRWRMGRFWPTSKWPTTHIAPTQMPKHEPLQESSFDCRL